MRLPEALHRSVWLKHEICFSFKHGICACVCPKHGSHGCVSLKHRICRSICLKLGSHRCDCLKHGIYHNICLNHASHRCVCLKHGICHSICLKHASHRCACLKHGICHSIYMRHGSHRCLKHGIYHGIYLERGSHTFPKMKFKDFLRTFHRQNYIFQALWHCYLAYLPYTELQHSVYISIICTATTNFTRKKDWFGNMHHEKTQLTWLVVMEIW